MKNTKRIITALIMVMMLGFPLFMTACSKDDGGEDIPEPTEVNVYMTLDLESDSDNGVEWTFEQDNRIFDCESTFLEDEGSEEGSGEVQSFELKPVRAGTATLTFRNEAKETTYTYEAEVGEGAGSITIKSSKGEAAGAETEAPQPIIEKD